MAEEHDYYPIPPEDLRCSYRDEAFVRCRNWRIQDQSFCQVHFLQYRDEGTMMVKKEKGTKSSVRVSKDEIEMTASAAPRRKGRGKEKGKTRSRRKRGRDEDEEEKEVIPERKVRRKLEETEEMKIEEEEEVDHDLEDSVAEEAPKRRGRKPAKEEIKVKEEEDDLEGCAGENGVAIFCLLNNWH